MLFHIPKVHHLYYGIILCRYAIICLLIHMLMDIWIISGFWLLTVKFLEHLYISLCTDIYFYFL